MDKELKDLKSVLRSIVVSSPAQVDVRSLQRDYRNMMGTAIPINKYGYRDVLLFLKERCADCFLFQGFPSNPVLTLIVPDSLKHIDQFVQRQKSSTVTKMKGKRRSVEEQVLKPRERPTYDRNTNMICETFNNKQSSSYNGSDSRPMPPAATSEPLNNNTKSVNNNHEANKYSEPPHSNNVTSYENNKPKEPYHSIKTNSSYKTESKYTDSHVYEEKENGYESEDRYSYTRKKRLPYDSSLYLDEEESSKPERALVKDDNDSGRQTASSGSSTKRTHLDQLKTEIHELIKQHPDGILCTDLMRLYRERYGRELNFNRAGHNNITSLLGAMRARLACSGTAGGVRVRVRDAALAPSRSHAPPRPPRSLSHDAPLVDPEDALPGIDFDADVFPADCMHYMESIPPVGVRDLRAGAMVPACVAEVYSPSHFWLQRLGDLYSTAMHRLMDEMTEYYQHGAGKSRTLARGAVCVGCHCAALFDGDWHRAIIVKIQDSESVKVRHVDYGTVDTVAVSQLKPLLRAYAALPAQAIRARLAGLRPSAGGRRWPHAAAQHLLQLVRDISFVANVVAVDPEEECIETFLIDTRGEDDVCVTAAMIRAGHADARRDSALRTGEWHLHPAWRHLEAGRAPNYADIHRYLAHGIALDYVPDYRATVPPLALHPAPAGLVDRVPLLQIHSPCPSPAAEPAATPPPPELDELPDTAAPCAMSDHVFAPEFHPTTTATRSPTVEPAPVPSPVPQPTVGASGWAQGAPCGPAPLVQWGGAAPPAQWGGAAPPAQWGGAAPPAQWGGASQWAQAAGPAMTREECALYNILMLADPAAAHCYMMVTLRRAAFVPHQPLNPLAPPFPARAPPSPRAPPGF